MVTRSNSSRDRILGVAESLILSQGFSATSIEDIVEHAAISKGGFFYHFDSKSALAEALVRRYLIEDEKIFSDLWKVADELSEDPLHQLLIFLKLMAEKMQDMQETHPGCLVASFTYESDHFNPKLRELMREGILNWRNMILTRLQRINEQYVLQSDVELEALADMFSSAIEGGIILARNFEENKLLSEQILAYRSFIRISFGAN